MDLVALEAIKQTKYAYMRCLDTKNWSEIRDCFTEDATAAYSGGKYAFDGREAIVGFLEKAMGSESFLSSHHVGHPEIHLESETRARGTWKLEDIVIDTRFGITIRGAAFYEDVYEKGADGRWRIRHTGYKRTFEEIESRADRPSLKLTASWWGTDGQSELDAGL